MTTFHLFNSFPLEIHSIILSVCPPIDRMCLRLTCKSLYNLSLSKDPVHLTADDGKTFCTPTITNPLSGKYYNRMMHRAECHSESYARYAEERREDGLRVAKETKCRSPSWEDHCTCFRRKNKLYQRLRNWVPKGLNYCGTCEKFTKRKPGHKGRCYHGVRKPRARHPGNFWTHRSRRGAFGYKIWKKWVRNSEMDQLERRLRSETTQRKGTDRYAMRNWVPKDVNTTMMRTGQSCEFTEEF